MKKLVKIIALIIVVLLSYGLKAQTVADSLELKKYRDMYEVIQKQYVSTDSVQIKRLGIMEGLNALYQQKVNEIKSNSVKKPRNEKERK